MKQLSASVLGLGKNIGHMHHELEVLKDSQRELSAQNAALLAAITQLTTALRTGAAVVGTPPAVAPASSAEPGATAEPVRAAPAAPPTSGSGAA